MPKLAHIQQGTQALRTKLAQKNVATRIDRADLDRALGAQVESHSKVLGDRIEGALNRLVDRSNKATSATLSRDIAKVVGLLQQSHQNTVDGLTQLAGQQVAAQEHLKEVIQGIEQSSQGRTQALQSDLVARLEQIAIDLGTVPRTSPEFPEIPKVDVNLDPLTDLTLEVLSKVSAPKVETNGKEFVFEVERDPFDNLITKVNVKEV
jgi:hypothetical protein